MLAENPRHQGLNTREHSSFVGPYGVKGYEAYAQNNTPGAYRIFFCYHPPKEEQMKIFAITPLTDDLMHAICLHESKQLNCCMNSDRRFRFFSELASGCRILTNTGVLSDCQLFDDMAGSAKGYMECYKLGATAMTEEVDKIKEVAKPQTPPETILHGGVIKNQALQANWRETQQQHMLGQEESATDLFYKPGAAKEGSQRFELFDSSNSHVEKIALRDDYLNRYELKPLQPIDGQSMTLHEALAVFKTPFMDAYEHSKQLKDGEPGKSKTLEEVVNRLKDCPWADRIYIKFDSKAPNTEYDNLTSAITIRPQDSSGKQVENFAHEAFHSTHQFLSKLYDHGIVKPNDFENIWLEGEVDSMLTEVRTHHELGLKGDPPRFNYQNNGHEEHIDIQEYVKERGRQGLLEFLRTAQPTGEGAKPYGEHYSSFYERYKENFEKNTSAVQKYIEQWVQSGHRRQDI